MQISDLLPYFSLYKSLKDAGRETLLSDELGEKEKEYRGKEIKLTGRVSEINPPRRELIVLYSAKTRPEWEFLDLHLITLHYFVFIRYSDLPGLVDSLQLEDRDLVQITGTIESLHRNSTLRMSLKDIQLLEKAKRKKKNRVVPGCFLASEIYGGTRGEVDQLYRFRDQVLMRSYGGRILIRTYYRLSPLLAKWIRTRPVTRRFLRRQVLDRILRRIGK
jgi:hypothetical protein